MKLKLKHLLFLCLCLSIQTLHAKHIISGTMAYTCLGNDDYQIEMILYRDCGGGGAAFDIPANFAVYKNGTLFLDLEAGIVSVDSVEAAPFEDCPDEFEGYCVQKGRYSFVVNLPLSPDSYTIAHQRCCWSGSISNILDPLDTGITVATELTPIAQSICNSQQINESQLAFAACPGTEITFEVPQSDSEGDSLTFQLCLPLKGAGPGGTPDVPGDPSICNGVVPDPVCPPPYEEVLYADGFDPSNPFPTIDGIDFDPVNNSFTFTPTTVGRYIFTLCMTEYRDGEVISQYRTNFHIQGEGSVSTDNPTLEKAEEVKLLNKASELVITANKIFENTSIQLLDYTGRLIRQKEVDYSNTIELNKSGIPSGIYFLSINGTNHKRIVKKVFID